MVRLQTDARGWGALWGRHTGKNSTDAHRSTHEQCTGDRTEAAALRVSHHSACGWKMSRRVEQRHSCATGTSAYSDDLVLPETTVQRQPPSEVTRSQSPTLNTQLDRPRGLRRHNELLIHC